MYRIDVFVCFVLRIMKCNVISSTWLLFLPFSPLYCCTNQDVTQHAWASEAVVKNDVG